MKIEVSNVDLGKSGTLGLAALRPKIQTLGEHFQEPNCLSLRASC
jgi:hypothetical protein